jgi:uncharacterized RDD family membrane protein YckC
MPPAPTDPSPLPTEAGPPPGVGWAPAVPVQREVAPGLVFSSTGARFVAWIVDGFLLAVIGVVITAFLGAFGLEATRTTPQIGPTGLPDYSTYFVADPVGSVLTVAVSAVYFIGSWTGGRRATPGQRLLTIQVGNAFDGRALTLDQAIRRWLGLGEPLVLFAAVPGLVGLSGLWFIWAIVLLVTTATSPTKQGLHDRLANSAVVRPVTAGNTWVVGCVVIAFILAAAALLSIVALVFIGSQVSSVLSTVGESV